MSLDLKHTEASSTPNSIDSRCLLVDAYISRYGDFCALNDDDTTDYYTPCACARGKNAVLILHNTCTYMYMYNSNITMSCMLITYNVSLFITTHMYIIESVDSISRDGPDMPYTCSNTLHKH